MIFIVNFDLNLKEKCEVYISFNEIEQSLLNVISVIQLETPDGGSHENALKNSLIKAIKIFGQKNQLTKSANISQSDLFDFSDSFISIFINNQVLKVKQKKELLCQKYKKN